ncbi:signal peptidase II [Candidatus Deianiraea vastatrix]|uniref:Lipoprotein signal peptidase n=1 Tax=Candidatus Deianiraea vastatrix TaxID=2163644 RepID=A0A5B8XH16_9RICK|nr:signal peptidase II [Candidatus Deianiraea vastatrix]QED23431.1 lipoprotein signal peptidase II [Candidatus Deianiraea vastatrix]
MKDIFIKNKGFFLQFCIIITLILVDQITKKLAINFFHNICDAKGGLNSCSWQLLSFFNLTFVCNYGVSFGMLSNISYGNIILSIIGILITIFFIKSLIQAKKISDKIVIILIISGAIGNLIDRILNSCVTDFIHLHYGIYEFPVFNIADCFVSLGAIIWILRSFFDWKAKKTAYILLIFLSFTGCKCKTIDEVKKERSETIEKIKRKSGEKYIIPPALNSVPEINECIKD